MNNIRYIYGRNAVEEAIKSGKTIEKIFIAYGVQGDGINRIFALSKKNGINCVSTDRNKFHFLEKDADIPTGKSQGIIALLRSFELLSIDELINSAYSKSKNPIIVALDEITDPQNLGAIARTAECAGASGLIITEKNSAPISPVAIKSSAGALELIPIARVSSLVQSLIELKSEGFWIIGTAMEADKLYTSEIYDAPVVIVIGSEGKGIRPSTMKHCDELIRIPLMGQINSLNASVSAAIVLYEVLRQRETDS